MDLQRGIMEFAGLKCGQRLMRQVIVHYRPLILALHGSLWHTRPLTTIPTITLVALPMQYAKLLFFFFSCVQFIYYIHFICGWAVSVESQYRLSCFNLLNVMPQAVTDIWAIFTSESAHSQSAGHIGDLEGAGASGIRVTGACLWASAALLSRNTQLSAEMNIQNTETHKRRSLILTFSV